jgi:hypothetical protein
MPQSKLSGPCSVNNCTLINKGFRRLTDHAWQKALTHKTLQQYSYLQKGQQICYPHYLNIVEPDHHESKEMQTAEHYSKKKHSIMSGNAFTIAFSIIINCN